MTEEPHAVPPAMRKDPTFVSPKLDGRSGPIVVAEVKPLEGHVKAGEVQGFSVRCDEAPHLGGTDTAPSPLGYVCVAVGF